MQKQSWRSGVCVCVQAGMRPCAREHLRTEAQEGTEGFVVGRHEAILVRAIGLSPRLARLDPMVPLFLRA